MRVGVAAATPALRAGLRALLDTAGAQVVAEAPSLAELAPLLAELDSVLVADETLLDELSDLDMGTTPLVVMSSSSRVVSLLRPAGLHGWGIVPPDAAPDMLHVALEAVSAGLAVLPQSVANYVLEQQPAVAALDAQPQAEALTAREQEVLLLLSQGLPNKLIARELGISEHTVKFHVSSLYAKLGASSRTEAVSQGARRGLISF
jgi:DNA-binding NarL/FixJ family response regulator